MCHINIETGVNTKTNESDNYEDKMALANI